MRAARPSRFVTGSAAPRPGPLSASTTDLVTHAVVEALARQRGAIDTLRGLRTVAIRVSLPAIAAVPRLDVRAVVVNLETAT